MRHEFIRELRSDSRRRAMNIMTIIDLRELKEAYLALNTAVGGLI
ncbi:hypothetical protein [Methanothrix sp.]|jgi:hypothetical protein